MSQWEPIPDETPIPSSGLIPKHIKTRAQLSIAEANNIHEVTTKYLAIRPGRRQAPFTLPWLYKLHRQMFGKVWQWAGQRRQTQLNIGCPAHQIDLSLQQLLDDLLYWQDHDTYRPIEQATRLHHRSVQIHPFENGNGRWARMLANIWLKQRKHGIILWPDQTIGSESPIRSQYITAIKSADAGDYTALIELHRAYCQRQE